MTRQELDVAVKQWDELNRQKQEIIAQMQQLALPIEIRAQQLARDARLWLVGVNDNGSLRFFSGPKGDESYTRDQLAD
jgi:hypothetical protein